MLHTRKSLGDKQGDRTVYVIEFQWTKNKWIPCQTIKTVGFTNYNEALAEMEALIKTDQGYIYNRRTLRIATYIRAEKE